MQHTQSAHRGWTNDQEDLLAGWAHKSAGLRWMHDRTSKQYGHRNNLIQVPSIMLSTLCGAAGFGTAGMSADSPLAPLTIGTLNLVCACLTAVGSYMKYQAAAEKHGLSANRHGAFYRDVTVELSLPRCDRQNSKMFLQQCRLNFGTIVDESPTIPNGIIAKYKTAYADAIKNNKIVKPDIANGDTVIRICRPPSSDRMACAAFVQSISTPDAQSAPTAGTLGVDLGQVDLDAFVEPPDSPPTGGGH